MSSRRRSSARSQDGTIKTRKNKRRTNSVDSPGPSNALGRLSGMDPFTMLPLNHQSILSDTTDIDEPQRKSWWKRLTQSPRQFMDIPENNDAVQHDGIIEELDIEIMSQPKENDTWNLPESSDAESFQSIVIPKRKLFNEKENLPHKIFRQFGTRENLPQLHQTNVASGDQTVRIVPKELFHKNKGPKHIFAANLVNRSQGTTAIERSMADVEPERQGRNLFGQHHGINRKNIFADFIVSESEDEIFDPPEIPKAKIFGFQSKLGPKRRPSSLSRGVVESSPTSSVAYDSEFEDWKLLPSSTMVDNQLEAMISGHPTKVTRLSKLSEKESVVPGSSRADSDQTKQSNKSILSNSTSSLGKGKNELNISNKNGSKLNQDKETTINRSHKKSNKSILSNSTSSLGKGKNELNISNKNGSKLNQDKETTINRSHKKSQSSVNNNHGNISQSSITTGFRSKHGVVEDVNMKSNVQSFAQNQNFIEQQDIETTLTAAKPEANNDDELNFTLVYENDGDAAEVAMSSDAGPVQDISQRKSSCLIKNPSKESKLNENSININDTNKLLKKPQTSITVDESGMLSLPNQSNEKTNLSTKHTFVDKTENCNIQQNLTSDCINNADGNIENVKDPSFNGQQNKQCEMQVVESNDHLEAKDENKQNNEKYPNEQQHINQEQYLKEPEVDNKDHYMCNEKEENSVIKVAEIKANETQHTGQKEIDQRKPKVDEIKNVSQEEHHEECINYLNKETEPNKQNISKEQDNEYKISNHINQPENNNTEDENQNVSRGDTDHGLQNEDEIAVDENNEKDESENDNEPEISIDINYSEYVETEDDMEIKDNNENAESGEEKEHETSNKKKESVNEEYNVTVNSDHEQKNDENEIEAAKNNETAESEKDIGQESSKDVNEVQDETEDEEKYISEEGTDQDHINEEDEMEVEEFTENDASEEENDQVISNEENENEETDDDNVEIEENNEISETEEEIEEEISIDEEQNTNQTDSNQEQPIEEDEIDENNESEQDNERGVSDDANESEDEEPDEEDQNVSQEENDQLDKENTETPNVSHDTTGRGRLKNQSPDMVLVDKTKQFSSFAAHGRNTSIRKSKSVIKAPTVTIRQSPASDRGSIGLADGTNNSSAEGSGWDSHRTTRKTLRQTFGKDFTPRKSLRALVMEKSARGKTMDIDMTAMTTKFPQANSTEYPEDTIGHEDAEINSEEEEETRSSLQEFLEKLKQKNLQALAERDEAIVKSLQTQRQNNALFKVPMLPKFRRGAITKPIKPSPKAKPPKSVKRWEELPEQLRQDLAYKPPRRYQPRDAAWITKRLYKYLENKLQPKYEYRSRVQAEKLVEKMYGFAKEVRRRRGNALPDSVNELKREMARLNIVQTHYEFHRFIYDFMPREIRLKVIPDLVNNIPEPNGGVFTNILEIL